jgi:hypothetical protein
VPAVVRMVNAVVAGLPPAVVRKEAGENEAFDNGGTPPKLRPTPPVKSLRGVIVTVNVAAPPAEMVAVLGKTEMVKSGGTKFPNRDTVWGFPRALSLIVTVPLRVPVSVGVKVTLKAQLAPGASAAGSIPHVFVWAKSPPFLPAIIIPLTVKAPSPLFVKVTVCGGLAVLRGWFEGKVRLLGEMAMAGPGMGAIFATKASVKPLPKDAFSGFTVGKSAELVCPVTWALPAASTAMPEPLSKLLPPR